MGDMFSKPSPPPSPDYQALAQQQGQNSLDLSKQQNPNVIGPYGSQTYYDSSPQDPTAYKTSLERQLTDYKNQMPVWENWDWRYANGLASGDNASERAATWFTNTTNDLNSKITNTQRLLDDFAKTGVVPSDTKHPTVIQKLSPEQQALYDQSVKNKGLLGDLATKGINSASGIIGSPFDLSGLPAAPQDSQTLRDQAYNAQMARVNEDYGRQSEDLNSNLVAAGLHPGSKAYDNQMNLLNRGVNDARTQAILNSGNVASQAYNMDAQSRQRALAEMITARQTPLNEITSLMSGSQQANPFSMQAPGGAQVAGTPYMQGAQANQQNQIDLFNLAQQRQANLNQGLFGLGAAGLMAYAAA